MSMEKQIIDMLIASHDYLRGDRTIDVEALKADIEEVLKEEGYRLDSLTGEEFVYDNRS